MSPVDANFADSKFNRYVIQWDGEPESDDRLSQWDMEVITMDFGE